MQFEEIVEYDRTDDVKTDKEFGSLMLSESSLRALARAGYISPSPVQVQAIPIGLLGFGEPLLILINCKKFHFFFFIFFSRVFLDVFI